MADYISTDPNAGVEQKSYLSTDPNFGLDQTPSVGEIAQHAGTAAVETAKGFIPKSLGEVLGLFTGAFVPTVGAVEDVGRGYGMLKDVLFGKPINEATAENFPETQIIPQAEQTAPYSEERFKAGFGALAQLGMAAIGGRGLAKTTEALPQIPETPISDAGIQQTQIQGGIENAQQIISPTQVHGDVQYASRPQESVREVPANVGSEGVQARGQGEIVQQTPQEVAATETGQDIQGFFKTAKNAATDSYIDNIWGKVQEGKPIQRIAPLENALREAQKSGQIKTREDVTRIFKEQLKPAAPQEVATVPQPEQPIETGARPVSSIEKVDQDVIAQSQKDFPNLPSYIQSDLRSDAAGVVKGAAQKVDKYFDAYSPQHLRDFHGEGQQLYNSFKPTRDVLRQKYGDTVTLYRAQGEERVTDLKAGELGSKNVLNYGSRELAEKYLGQSGKAGRKLISKQVPIDDIVAVYSGKGGDAYVVLNRDSSNLKPPILDSPVSEPTEAATAQPLTQVIETPPTVSETTPKGQAEPQSITSIKNEQVDRERSTRGLPPVVEPARKAFGETWEQATKKIDDDPGYPDRLIEELKAKPRALNDVEDAALLHRQVDLQNQFQKSTDALFNARETGDAVGAMEHDARVNALSDQLLELYDVGKKAGTETGRGLAARQLLSAEDFSMANMVTQKRAANPTIDVGTATKSAQEASDKISAAQTALDQYQSSPKAEAYKKRLKTLTEQYRTKTAQGDFAKRTPAKITLDKEGQALKADLERAKKDWLTALQKDRAANRTPSQKFWDRFVGVERAMKLSSDVVLAKLSAAALVREAGLTPAEEVVGAGIGKILPGLAKRAPREGGFSPAAEIKTKSEMFTSGMKDAWQNLKMKHTDLDTLYSSRKPPPPSEFYDYLGYLHGALKAPIKRAEFARSLTKRMKWAVENGQDLNNVNTMRELSEESYTDANRSIFMQDNVVASTFTGALRMAEMSKKAPNLGPAVARIGRFLVPIVKIPTNIVGEVATGIHGVATGGSRAAVAYLKGIDSLPTVQADSIMRQLKKGAIGNALLLTGYYTANNIGGFYHDQDKRTKEDVQPGRYRIGSVDIPASAGHSTGAMLLNIGATVKRVENEQIRKSESTMKGLGEGIRAAAAGLAHEIPFVPAATGITDALGTKGGFEKYINGMIQSTTVPALSSHIAKILDTPGSLPNNILQEPVRRKATTPLEAFKMGIPGKYGRESVPDRGEKVTKAKPRQGL